MAFILQSIVLCILFTWAVPVNLMRNPINVIMSYPVAIRKRVEVLPQYRETIKKLSRSTL